MHVCPIPAKATAQNRTKSPGLRRSFKGRRPSHMNTKDTITHEDCIQTCWRLCQYPSMANSIFRPIRLCLGHATLLPFQLFPPYSALFLNSLQALRYHPTLRPNPLPLVHSPPPCPLSPSPFSTSPHQLIASCILYSISRIEDAST